MSKKLQKGSKYEQFDLDGDGIVTDEELAMEEKMMRLDNEDKKQDAQRYMAWFSFSTYCFEKNVSRINKILVENFYL